MWDLESRIWGVGSGVKGVGCRVDLGRDVQGWGELWIGRVGLMDGRGVCHLRVASTILGVGVRACGVHG